MRSPRVSVYRFSKVREKRTDNRTEIYRDVPGARIPGGSEDVLLDLAIRQMVKNFQDKTKAIKASRL